MATRVRQAIRSRGGPRRAEGDRADERTRAKPSLDAACEALATPTLDSTGPRLVTFVDSASEVVDDASGVMPEKEILDAHEPGRISTYQQVKIPTTRPTVTT